VERSEIAGARLHVIEQPHVLDGDRLLGEVCSSLLPSRNSWQQPCNRDPSMELPADALCSLVMAKFLHN
jgi:hypothetical protein